MNPDERRNTQVALEMRDSSIWLVPTLNGHPYLDKSELVNIGGILVRMD
jgi:4-amino-4-deoxy-L-arabinose transferase-like glycosyltransferase